MTTHEWREHTEEGLRYWRAEHHGGKWKISTTLKTDPEWENIDPIPLPVWEQLREKLWHKYQRRRCPWKLIANIDKILNDAKE